MASLSVSLSHCKGHGVREHVSVSDMFSVSVAVCPQLTPLHITVCECITRPDDASLGG